MSNSDLSVDPVLEPATPEPVPVEPVAVEPAPVPEIPAPEPQPVDATGQLIPTPEPEFVPGLGTHEVDTTPEPEAPVETATEVATEEVTSGSSGEAYSPPPADFEHTAFNPDDVQHIS